MKHLNEISWQVPEPEYRQDPALSYSTLAKFEREGFSKLPTLFEHVSSPSLTFGSVVDELITGDSNSFNDRFEVAEFPNLKPSSETCIKALYEKVGDTLFELKDIPSQTVLATLNKNKFFTTWRNETRLKEITKPECAEYYRLLCSSNGKEVISQETYDIAFDTAAALRESPSTRAYFGDNHGNGIERYYQLKFKDTINGIDFRCMADLIIVNHNKKQIIPCDLKTSGHHEWEFAESFLQWRYDIQARLYWRIIRDNLDKDPYFKDFELLNYRFIVVNKESKTPLVWEFPETKNTETLWIGNKKLRTPWEIGKQLRNYLDTTPSVPDGINLVGVNDICKWFNYEQH
jgi:hypothetical protein